MSRYQKISQENIIYNNKTPKKQYNPESFFDKSPVWSFKLLDNNYKKWGFVHAENLYETVITKLKELEGQTWSEILGANGGRKYGTNNHFENVSKLIPEAQKRWKELKLDEYDRVFSLRLTGTHRLYGILLDGVFKVIWLDLNHEIYEMSR